MIPRRGFEKDSTNPGEAMAIESKYNARDNTRAQEEADGKWE